MTPIHLVIAEDNTLFRETLGQILSDQGELYKIVGEAGNGGDAINLVRQLAPDVLVLDLQMPEMDGFEVLGAVKEYKRDLKILVLTMNGSQAKLQKALAHGADGYCTKTSGKNSILKAVEQVSMGKPFICIDTDEA